MGRYAHRTPPSRRPPAAKWLMYEHRQVRRRRRAQDTAGAASPTVSSRPDRSIRRWSGPLIAAGRLQDLVDHGNRADAATPAGAARRNGVLHGADVRLQPATERRLLFLLRLQDRQVVPGADDAEDQGEGEEDGQWACIASPLRHHLDVIEHVHRQVVAGRRQPIAALRPDAGGAEAPGHAAAGAPRPSSRTGRCPAS